MSPEDLATLDEAFEKFRKQAFELIEKHADDKPIFVLMRLYSKFKMLCVIYDTVRNRKVKI